MMKTWFLPILALVSLCVQCQAVDSVSQGNAPLECRVIWEKMGKIMGRLKGRALAAFVQKGMTVEQVVQVLGRGSKPLPTGGMVGGLIFGCLAYWDLGLTVQFWGDKDGVLRVDRIDFAPLLPPKAEMAHFAERWQALCDALDVPPRNIPAPGRLLQGTDPFDGKGPATH